MSGQSTVASAWSSTPKGFCSIRAHGNSFATLLNSARTWEQICREDCLTRCFVLASRQRSVSNLESPEPSPTVSVVVPCRNELVHIERCVRSLLSQASPPGGYEIIIVDGMSDDGTRDVLRCLASQDARLRLVDNPSGITPCGMNCGIRAARGGWIAIMGSHNRYAPTTGSLLWWCTRPGGPSVEPWFVRAQL
jgi:hypothetical protein